jgi:hypothetical protein
MVLRRHLVDVFTGDPLFEPASTACLHAHLRDGLVISPVTFAELGHSFLGDDVATSKFLATVGIATSRAELLGDGAEEDLVGRRGHGPQAKRKWAAKARKSR